MRKGFTCKVKCKISVLREWREFCWTKRCQAAQSKFLFLKNFGVRLRMRASSVYEPIVWVSGRDWNLGDSPGVASSLLRDGATLTATLSANPWGIESFFIRTLFKEWGGNFRLSPCYKRPLMIVSFFLCSFLIYNLVSNWWVLGDLNGQEVYAGVWVDCACAVTFWLVWVSWDWVGHLGLFWCA